MKLTWDAAGERFYETGVDRGVLYPYDSTNKQFTNGVAWNGLSAVNESPSGAEANAIYADNIKYLNLVSIEEYAATIECYTYPDEFQVCAGFAELAPGVTIGQQDRKMFGFCYRTLIGNDTEGTNTGYKPHCVYNCLAAPASKDHSTTNESPEATSMSFEISTTPVAVTDRKPTAVVEIDSTKCDPAQLSELEDILYGTATAVPRLPLPDEIAQIVGAIGVTVKLNALTIGTLDLTPDFDPRVSIYACKTENATDIVTATADAGISVSILVNGSSHTSGSAATWSEGTNTVIVVATKSGQTSRSYAVTVTKETEEDTTT